MFKKSLLLVSLILLLSGCSGGTSKSNSPEMNTTNPDTNQTHPDQNTTTPDDNVTTPDDNVTVPDDNITLPDQNITIPDQNLSTPYTPQIIRGRTQYLNHCAVCHKEDATGGVGPNIRGINAQEIIWAVENEADMGHLKGVIVGAIPEEIAAYLKLLKEDTSIIDPNDDSEALLNLRKIALGELLFFDRNLSLNRTMSCATCHDPQHGFIDARFHKEGSVHPVAGALSLGDDGVSLGGRNAPTVGYAQFAPDFYKRSSDGRYVGGQFHDGRALNLKAQAKGPFLDKAEMMMPDAASVMERVQENDIYTEELKALYGEDILSHTDKAYDAVAQSIAKFEKSPLFAPFDSKYDRSKLPKEDPNYYEMTALEKEGYALYFDRTKTNCVLCHAINSTSESSKETFTNYTYENIGTPKNLQALMVRDGNTEKIDLGLGGRAEINDPTVYGKFKVSTLRNIAITGPYMSNGVFKELRTVLAFYDHMIGNGTRPLNPETGKPWDAPEVNATINHALLSASEPLTNARIDALEAFLKLLTDQRYEPLLIQE